MDLSSARSADFVYYMIPISDMHVQLSRKDGT